ncbi:signal peptidase II, partial [Acinetobacter baumannii]
MTASKKGLFGWLALAALVVLLDQGSKLAVLKNMAYGVSHAITPFFNLVLVYNKGAAFSFLAQAGGWQRWLFTALGV